MATKRRRSTAVARRRRPSYRPARHYRRPRMTLPLAVVAGFVPTMAGVWNRRGSATEIANYLQAGWTGITPEGGNFSFTNLRAGLIPALAGFAVHKVASMMGINRALGRARIPFVRV